MDKDFKSFLMLMGILFACWLLLMAPLLAVSNLLFKSSEVVQHRVGSPDGKITAELIRDDCGATCACMIRVDLHAHGRSYKEVYRNYTACDANLVWLGSTELQITPYLGLRDYALPVRLDMKRAGVVP